jgi:hypothetical protein
MAESVLNQRQTSYDPTRWAQHTAYTEPGRHAGLLADVPTDLRRLSAVANNLIIHYRASGRELPAETKDDINARWLESILDLDQQRHPVELAVEREPLTRVQGCCRDHSLFGAAVLRQNGRPARIRYGFAAYFAADFHYDHVIVETWLEDQQRWLRFDPEVVAPTEQLTTPQDLPAGEGAPFRTAAEVWTDYRAGRIDDPDRYGVDPGTPIRGAWFIQGAVLFDAAFRAGYEFLLWDGWDALSTPDGPTETEADLADQLSKLIIAADAGDVEAENQLLERVNTDPAVRPGDVVETLSPYGDPPTMTDLSQGPPRRA